jgi:acetoacetate decarboxylase
MNIDPKKLYFMPLIRGPIWDLNAIPPITYQSVESLMLQYETDPEAIPPLLPEPFKPGKSPIVTVLFNDCNGVGFMSGRGYRMAAVSVDAKFDGEQDHVEGGYVLVMPENETLAITTGREWLGMPKFFTDISSIRIMENGHLRCEASLWGHLFFGLDIKPPFKKQIGLVRKTAAAQSSKAPALGYKYIGSLDGIPDADYPTIMWNDVEMEELWLAKGGEFFIGDSGEEDIGEFKPVLDILRSLPVRKVVQAVHWKGSLVLRNDKNRRLH